MTAGCGVNALSGLHSCSRRPDKTRQRRIRQRTDLAVLLQHRTTQRQDLHFVRSSGNAVYTQVTPEAADAVVARNPDTAQHLHCAIHHFKCRIGAEVFAHRCIAIAFQRGGEVGFAEVLIDHVFPAVRAQLGSQVAQRPGVIAGEGHAGKIYELAGDNAWTLSDLAAELSTHSGKNVVYQNLSEADFAAALKSVGLPAGLADMLADSDVGASKGGLFDDSHTLSTLIGRPTTSLAESVKGML